MEASVVKPGTMQGSDKAQVEFHASSTFSRHELLPEHLLQPVYTVLFSS